MSDESKVSIAMAVYNGERFLQEQLDSFVRQTRLPYELVVSDNASTDLTVEILRAFATRAPFPVRIFINDRNLGVSKNFERAIQECTGDIIFLSDCDDVWYSDKILLMAHAFGEHERSVIVVSDADLVDEFLRPIGSTLWTSRGFAAGIRALRRMELGEGLSRSAIIHGNCMAFRATINPLIVPLPSGPDSLTGTHDYFIAWTALYAGAGGIFFERKPLIAYRQHSRQVSEQTGINVADRRGFRMLFGAWRARHSRPLEIMQAILDRLQTPVAASQCANERMRLAVIRHWRARCELPHGIVARTTIVGRELATMRYHRFSNGVLSAAKDLFFVRNS